MAIKISAIMNHDVEVASRGDTLQSVAQMMEDLDVGALPAGEGDRLDGMITERDLAICGVARGKSPADCTVGEIMRTELQYCFEDETVEAVAERMGTAQIRRLPVLTRDKRLVGIVSLGDLATVGDETAAAEALRDVSEPAGGQA